MGQGRFPHPLADVPLFGASYIIPPIPAFANGSVETVNVGANVSMRLIADPSNWDRTQQGIALGESGDPVSPHWRDQFEDWQRVTPRMFPFTRDAVAGAGRETLVLTPAN